MISRLRAIPPGVLGLLGYAFAILVLIGLSLRWVIDQAVAAPVSLPGIVVMVLLAYTIFTITLVLQRKAAARGLALGLASLTLPAVALMLLSGLLIPAIVCAVVGAGLLRGLTRPSVRAYLSEP
jgi:hypothetical protein